MIHIEPQPEPPTFDECVRQPGLRALAEGAAKLPPYYDEYLLHQSLSFDLLLKWSPFVAREVLRQMRPVSGI